ncbi:unnamed protein product [Mytilus coruscus]|uniref:Uncharacterized protein n=1 Tax=Mytilus coruscus TaxID=42192 RepID=A0A6J8B267_MYTCO|nr:unnamed protein product [Mytilus coruscus]
MMLNSIKTTNAPEGTVAAKSVKLVEMISSELEHFKSTIQMSNSTYPVQMQTLLTVAVENLHAVSHFKDENQTMLQYSRNLFNKVYEGLKRNERLGNDFGKYEAKKRSTGNYKVQSRHFTLNLYASTDNVKQDYVLFPKGSLTEEISEINEDENEQQSEYESSDSDVSNIEQVETTNHEESYDISDRPDCLTFLLGFTSRSGRCVRVSTKFADMD